MGGTETGCGSLFPCIFQSIPAHLVPVCGVEESGVSRIFGVLLDFGIGHVPRPRPPLALLTVLAVPAFDV